MAEAASLIIFSLFDVTSAQEVPFGIFCGLTSVLLCVTFIFADSESVNLVVACNGLLCITEIMVAALITEVLFK